MLRHAPARSSEHMVLIGRRNTGSFKSLRMIRVLLRVPCTALRALLRIPSKGFVVEVGGYLIRQKLGP